MHLEKSLKIVLSNVYLLVTRTLTCWLALFRGISDVHMYRWMC